MLARCARCQGTFSADRFGVQRCPHCGAEVLLADPNAPAPGAPPGPPPAPPPRGGFPPAPPSSFGAPQGGPPPPAGAPPSPEAELPAPFVERRQRGFFPAFFQTWKLSALEPASFFRRVRIDQTGSAVWFAVIAVTVGSWVMTLFNWVGSAQKLQEAFERSPAELESWKPIFEWLFSGSGLLAQLLTTPILALVSVYLGAGVTHLLLLLFRGAQRGFPATLTAAGYASGLGLLSAVPGCGGIVAMVWSAVVFIIGLGATQRCGTGKAAAAVLLPVLLLCACCAGVLALVVAAAVQAAGGGATSL
ncbi:MAG TPA: YIP1 family protein [Anaeromyxobacteraceae bacterium]|nr:YIP1 family protein [Anaeromyxobacteraceae bacterium]